MSFPLSHFNKLIGMEFVEFHGDGATLHLQLREEHLNGAGVVHGGVMASLADAAIGCAIFNAVGKPVTTVEFKINYLKPAIDGILVARSHILRVGRRLAVARAEVHCGDVHISEVLATFAVLEPRTG